MATVLELEKITKIFPKVIANQDVDLKLEQGEVHALLGENGAGKSTLMNCLYGLYRQDGGKIIVRGEEVEINSSDDAIKLGIGMVHQHFMLVPELTVAENIILGLKSSKEPLLNLDAAEKKIQELSDKYNFGIHPRDKVRTLPVGIQQRVEILKVLYREADILILDEATAVLTPQEVTELFKVVKKLTSEGKSVLIITHKLEEVMALSNQVTVLRDGKVAGNVRTTDTNPTELANMMVGREVLFKFHEKEMNLKEIYLETKNLKVVDKKGVVRVNNLSMQIHGGEILGIAGVDGNGQNELAEAITGMIPFQEGSVVIRGIEKTKLEVRDVYEQGISHIPQDRHHTGLVLPMAIKDNLVLTDHYRQPYSKNGIFNRAAVNEHGADMIEQYYIKAPDADVPARELSGGNQQKIILARELCREPDILVAVQPSRGLDIGATEFVRQKLIDQRDRGAAVLLVSTELEEILQVSDRIAVMYEGEFMGVVNNGEATIQEIGLMMAGTRRTKAHGQEEVE